jgi:DNA/RNA-binding domain of Phe-tRNA-synthetase-like protein
MNLTLILDMKFSIDTTILTKILHEYSVAFVVVTDLELRKDAAAAIEKELTDLTEARIRLDYTTEDSVMNNAVVSKYVDVLKILGIEATVSLQNLLNMIAVKKKTIVMGDPLINFYNNFVLKRELPAGGYDLDRIVGDVSIRYASSEERFKQLNKDSYQLVAENSIVFADQSEVLCADWVYKQSDTQKIRPTTKNVLFRIEGLGKTKKELKS